MSDIIEKLKIEKQKWVNKIYGVGETRIDLMIDDVIEELETKNKELTRNKVRISSLQYQLEKQDKELETLKKKVDILENKVHYKICENCNKEYRTKRSDTKYCKECAKKVNNSNWYSSLTDKKKQERREKSKLAMRKYRAKSEVLKDE